MSTFPKHQSFAAADPQDVPVAAIARAEHSLLVRQLLEVVAALDRRTRQVLRRGEAAIVRDAATLRQRALQRIAELSAAQE